MKLSVVVPAYQEAEHIKKNIEFFHSTFKNAGIDFEIVLVVDGCAETYKEAKQINLPEVRVLFYEENQGKGFALKYGMQKARGEYIATLDADNELNPASLIMFLHLAEDFGMDIVIGSKRHPLSKVHYPLTRRFYSWCYQVVLRVLFNLKVKDTQVGIKLYRREVLEKVLPRVLVKRFAFPVELLAVANYFGFTKIMEAPVELKYNFAGSNVNIRETFKILWDTAAIFYRLKLIRYYDKNKPFVSAESAASPRVCGKL